MNRSQNRLCAAVIAALVTSGCYKYVPTEAALVTQGQDVRVSVTRLGAAELAQVSAQDVTTGRIDGTMQIIENDDMVLRVPVGERQEGFASIDLVQTIRVPMGEVLLVERREIDPLMTGVVVAGSAVGIAAVIFGIIEAFGSGGPDDGIDPPDESVVGFSLLSLPWSF